MSSSSTPPSPPPPTHAAPSVKKHVSRKSSASDLAGHKQIRDNFKAEDATADSNSSLAAAESDHSTSESPHLVGASQSNDADLFSFLSAMHLSGGGGPANIVNPSGSNSVQLVSRKRKFLEQGFGSGCGPGGSSGKLNGLRPPFMRRGSDEDDDVHAALHTPHVSQSGYADEEDHHHDSAAAAAAVSAAVANLTACGQLPNTIGSSKNNRIVMSPINAHIMSEIDDNLAANFDDSLSGLGVDISTASYSMSEALLALPNLSISSGHIFKQEVTSPSPSSSSTQPQHRHAATHGDHRVLINHDDALHHSTVVRDVAPTTTTTSAIRQNFGALDLSNDEAHLPDGGHTNSDEAEVLGPKNFIGSVSRESSRGGTPHIGLKSDSMDEHLNNLSSGEYSGGGGGSSSIEVVRGQQGHTSAGAAETIVTSSPGMSSSNPNLSSVGKAAASGTAAGVSSSSRAKTPMTVSVEKRSSLSSGRGTSHKVILPLQFPAAPSPTVSATTAAPGPSALPPNVGTTPNPAVVTTTITVAGNSGQTGQVGQAGQVAKRYDRLNETSTTDDVNKFQYILLASTSLATKISDPSITYLNQGQSYELRLKKLGDLSAYRKKLLKCSMRICFHERRLQYMEAEQIAEWKNAHPGERILDIDVPLSYGIIDPVQNPDQLNVLSFKWDPTRDTGIYIKLNCISTEFTPKKHGGEKGVPFRLQVETYDPQGNVRLHASGCILQVFKLKGADRKHKQDRDKISKRPQHEQEKYSPSYDCTVLTDLSIENIYVPPVSRSQSPNSPGSDVAAAAVLAATTTTSAPTARVVASTAAELAGSRVHKVAPAPSSSFAAPSHVIGQSRPADLVTVKTSPLATPEHHTSVAAMATPTTDHLMPSLSVNAGVEAVAHWLQQNRYSAHLDVFRNFNGRDLLRLMRDDVIGLCGVTDGIRLYNDLHMVVVAPRTTFYVARRDEHEYQALFLEELTLNHLLLRLSEAMGGAVTLQKVFIVGPQGILIRVTDSVVQYTKPETVFQYVLKETATSSLANRHEACYDIVLENVTPLVEGVSPTELPPPPPAPPATPLTAAMAQHARPHLHAAHGDVGGHAAAAEF